MPCDSWSTGSGQSLLGASVQEKQIRAKASMRELRERMRTQRLQVADRVSKRMLANVRLFPKVSERPAASG